MPLSQVKLLFILNFNQKLYILLRILIDIIKDDGALILVDFPPGRRAVGLGLLSYGSPALNYFYIFM